MPIPTPTIVADLVVKTKWAYRRNRLYYEPTANPGDEIALGHCADAIFNAFKDDIVLLMPDEHYFQRVECRFYGPGSTGFFANSSVAPVVGDIETPDENTTASDIYSASEDILPDEVSLIIQKKTGLTGRANQGRLFLTGLSERVNFAGEVSAGYRGSAATVAALVATDVSVSVGAFVSVLHARHWNRKTNDMKPITKTYVVNGMGSRRDRRRPVPMERL